MKKVTKIELPHSWTVEEDEMVGATYRDEYGSIVFQHPWDNPTARYALLERYSNRKEG